jgi:hypothetical protein
MPNTGTLLRTPTLSINTTGKLNLQNNKLIVTTPGSTGTWNGSAYTGVTGDIARGRNGGGWTGTGGIITTQTAATTGNLTSIGIAKASDVRPATATATAVWAGQTITGTDTLVMYTYGGDATLDGKINVDDYIRIDNGISAHLTGWANGDFNYDGKVNIDDYTQYIDANIGIQGAPFPTASGLLAGGDSLATDAGSPGQTVALTGSILSTRTGLGGIGAQAVPEPASGASLIAMSLLGAAQLRRRRTLTSANPSSA